MGCEKECIVESSGWPTPYFYDYPGISVAKRVEADPIAVFFGPDTFVISGFVPTLLFWLMAVYIAAYVVRTNRPEV